MKNDRFISGSYGGVVGNIVMKSQYIAPLFVCNASSLT